MKICGDDPSKGESSKTPIVNRPKLSSSWTSSALDTPIEPEYVQIKFKSGIPTSINGQEMNLLELIGTCNGIAGKHGIGRIDMMEDRMIGMKVRENYQCPGATILLRAHKELEGLVCTGLERKFKGIVDQQWAELAYSGHWGNPLFEDLVAFSEAIQKRVTGTVNLKLYKGHATIAGRESTLGLYNHATASFDDSDFSQSSMEGMVSVHGISTFMYAEAPL